MTRPGAEALNKPLFVIGLDREPAGLPFVFSVIIGANGGGSKIAAVVSDQLESVSDLHQFEILDALKVSSVPCKQRQAMNQSNAGDQTVTHPDSLPRTVKFAANICRLSGCSTVQGQHFKRLKQLSDCVTTPIFTRTTQELKTAYSRGLDLFCANVFRDLSRDRLDITKKINKDICVGDNHRQLSRSSFVVRRNSSASFCESEPASDSRVLRRFSRSTSSCKKLSIASASTAENPLCPRRDARARRALRCSGFISTVVLIDPFYMHVHASLSANRTSTSPQEYL
jgi:hypothetical protein